MMLRVDEYRFAFLSVDGISTLLSILASRVNFQVRAIGLLLHLTSSYFYTQCEVVTSYPRLRYYDPAAIYMDYGNASLCRSGMDGLC